MCKISVQLSKSITDNVKVVIKDYGIMVKTVLTVPNSIIDKIERLPDIPEFLTTDIKYFCNKKNSYLYVCRDYTWKDLSVITDLSLCLKSQYRTLNDVKNYLIKHLDDK